MTQEEKEIIKAELRRKIDEDSKYGSSVYDVCCDLIGFIENL